MSDKRRLKSIASRYDLDVFRHRDPWRILRSRLSYIFTVGSIMACIPWLWGDHRVFQSKCVSNAHRTFEQKCSNCHDRSFVPILRMITFDNTIPSTSDKKCQACHRESSWDHLPSPLTDDVPPVALRKQTLAEQMRPDFAKRSCANCHDEHRGNAKLAQVADALCSKCHQQAHNQISPPRFQLDFSDFSHHSKSQVNSHPEFAIWRDPTLMGEHRESTLVKWENDRPVDRAAIRFSHHRHLDFQLPTPDRKATTLNCIDCHQPDSSGAYFLPIQFKQHCDRCHNLGFPSTGKLPHLEPGIIHSILLDRVRKLPNQRPLPAQVDHIGGPTKPPISPTKLDANSPPTLDALVRDLNTLEEQLFAASPPLTPAERPTVAGLLEAACTKCHLTKRNEGTGEAWSVIAPRMPAQWMSHSRFRHDRHLSVDCTLCHTRNGEHPFDAVPREEFYPVKNGERIYRNLDDKQRRSSSIYASVSAQDVLMPRIEICRQCHGHASVREGTISVGERCVDCHAYHHAPATSLARPGIHKLLSADDRPGGSQRNPHGPAAEAGP